MPARQKKPEKSWIGSCEADGGGSEGTASPPTIVYGAKAAFSVSASITDVPFDPLRNLWQPQGSAPFNVSAAPCWTKAQTSSPPEATGWSYIAVFMVTDRAGRILLAPCRKVVEFCADDEKLSLPCASRGTNTPFPHAFVAWAPCVTLTDSRRSPDTRRRWPEYAR